MFAKLGPPQQNYLRLGRGLLLNPQIWNKRLLRALSVSERNGGFRMRNICLGLVSYFIAAGKSCIEFYRSGSGIWSIQWKFVVLGNICGKYFASFYSACEYNFKNIIYFAINMAIVAQYNLKGGKHACWLQFTRFILHLLPDNYLLSIMKNRTLQTNNSNKKVIKYKKLILKL